jgi:hypothetical protein
MMICERERIYLGNGFFYYDHELLYFLKNSWALEGIWVDPKVDIRLEAKTNTIFI